MMSDSARVARQTARPPLECKFLSESSQYKNLAKAQKQVLGKMDA